MSRRFQFSLLALLVAIVLAPLLSAGCYLVLKRREIAAFDDALEKTPLGSTAADLENTLGAQQLMRSQGNLFIASKSTLGDHERQGDCIEQHVYVVQTFFLPVIYVFGFDECGRLASKFRLD
jgi:hypothetical protein